MQPYIESVIDGHQHQLLYPMHSRCAFGVMKFYRIKLSTQNVNIRYLVLIILKQMSYNNVIATNNA